jgi:hypothetical protein
MGSWPGKHGQATADEWCTSPGMKRRRHIFTVSCQFDGAKYAAWYTTVEYLNIDIWSVKSACVQFVFGFVGRS